MKFFPSSRQSRVYRVPGRKSAKKPVKHDSRQSLRLVGSCVVILGALLVTNSSATAPRQYRQSQPIAPQHAQEIALPTSQATTAPSTSKTKAKTTLLTVQSAGLAIIPSLKSSGPSIKTLVIQPNLNFTHTNIITTEFWVGEPADGDNGGISNTSSTWDGQWQKHFGGVDDATKRNGYLPAAFTPYENVFYFALPYSDLDSEGVRKASATQCLQFSGNQPTNYSWCKNTWIAISYQGKTAYAQWEDAGPFGEDDTAYVFGTAAPSNTTGADAGLDVSPAMTTYLGLDGLNRTSWQFVPTSMVPDGPWKQQLTTTTGESVN